MLVFIGMGLYDERDLTLRGVEEARNCDRLFADLYTSLLPGGGLEGVAGLLGKPVIPLGRADLEERGEEILDLALRETVGLLVIGDPLISTTHVHLRLEAHRRGIPTRIVHNASIHSAAPSLSGLQNYKFGRSATLVLPEGEYLPESPYEALRENRKRGLHTLLFLDLRVTEGGRRVMSPREGMEVLLQIEEKRREGFFTEETLCVVLGRVGSPEPLLRAGKVGELLEEDFGGPPHTLIVPGELHFLEEEYLQAFSGVE
jgi:diphthine synthase